MIRKIAVVGGGLSGLYAALTAAQHGADVVLYEKNEIGTKHNCGEMFTEIYTSVPNECISEKIHIFRFIVGDEKIDINLGEHSPFLMTDKCTHEMIIKERCLSAGVDIKEKTKVTTTTKDRYVIDASGRYYGSGIGKAVTYISKRSAWEDMCLPVNSGVALFKVNSENSGYSWVFPKGNFVNHGHGVYDYRLEDTAYELSSAKVIYKGGGILPMPSMAEYYHNLSSINANIINCLKVGNAAGLVNPCLGGGEHLAVISGILAGQCAANGKTGKYVDALSGIIGDEMRFGVSAYEFAKKQDTESLKMILKSYRMFDYSVLNSTIRKAMAKWIQMPDVSNDEMIKFVEE